MTASQVESVRKIANEKKVGRTKFQQALDDGRVSRFLDGLKSGEILPPHGACIHTLRVTVIQDQPWQEAVNAAGPNTPRDYNVHKVGDLYLPIGTGKEEQEHILLNYPSGDGGWDKASAWAEGKDLKRTVPREVFAISTQYSELHRTLGINPMYVVATTECSFAGDRRACGVWWYGSGREAYLGWVGGFTDTRGWFAFRKPSVSTLKP